MMGQKLKNGNKKFVYAINHKTRKGAKIFVLSFKNNKKILN